MGPGRGGARPDSPLSQVLEHSLQAGLAPAYRPLPGWPGPSKRKAGRPRLGGRGRASPQTLRSGPGFCWEPRRTQLLTASWATSPETPRARVSGAVGARECIRVCVHVHTGVCESVWTFLCTRGIVCMRGVVGRCDVQGAECACEVACVCKSSPVWEVGRACVCPCV